MIQEQTFTRNNAVLRPNRLLVFIAELVRISKSFHGPVFESPVYRVYNEDILNLLQRVRISPNGSISLYHTTKHMNSHEHKYTHTLVYTRIHIHVHMYNYTNSHYKYKYIHTLTYTHKFRHTHVHVFTTHMHT